MRKTGTILHFCTSNRATGTHPIKPGQIPENRDVWSPYNNITGPVIQSLGVQNSKASKIFDSQPLGCVICSNHIDYNLIILIFKGDVLINFHLPPPVPMCPHVSPLW